MTDQHHTLADDIRRCDAQLDTALRRRVGISVDTYKTLRFALRFLGIAIAAAAIFAPEVSADPVPSLTIIAAFVLGPDVVEAYLTNKP